AEDGIRDRNVTGVQTCALPISLAPAVVEYHTPNFTRRPGSISAPSNVTPTAPGVLLPITGVVVPIPGSSTAAPLQFWFIGARVVPYICAAQLGMSLGLRGCAIMFRPIIAMIFSSHKNSPALDSKLERCHIRALPSVLASLFT